MNFAPEWSNFGQFISEKASILGGKTFLTVADDGSSDSYGEFDALSIQMANWLCQKGINKGDVVAIICYNVREYLITLYGCLKIGALLCPINPRLAEEEYLYILQDSGARLAIADNAEMINNIKSRCPELRYVVNIDELCEEICDCGKELRDVHVSLADNALLLYSSGTTGNPKGIVLTHGNILHNSRAASKHFNMDHGMIFLLNAPLFFSGGLFPSFFAPLYAGASFVIARKFSKTRFWHIIAKYNVTATFCAPTMLSILLNPPEDISGLDIKMDFIFGGGSYAPADLIERFERMFGVKYYILYGLTENSAVCSASPLNDRRLKSLGIPFDSCEMKVFGNRDKEVPDSITGEIVIRGPIIMKEYLNNPKETAQALKGGWLHSGDLGYRKDGYYYYIARKKELIIKGGENISPAQIESVILRHPDVSECAVVGVPDSIYGEDIAAFVVPREGKIVKAGELISFCRQHISEFKCPKEIIIADSIPKTASGKVLRRKLAMGYGK
ncbi:MAG: class I adenylate-forming enzyme family protein [archaeon]